MAAKSIVGHVLQTAFNTIHQHYQGKLPAKDKLAVGAAVRRLVTSQNLVANF